MKPGSGVTAKDDETVYIPTVESMIQEYGTVRLLYQIGPDFRGFSPGAVWDDEKLGVSHHLTTW